jgi:hypothetical protein
MKSQKGSIIVPLILVIIVAFGVLLTTDTLYNKTATNPLQLFTNPEVDKSGTDQNNLQLEKLKFKPYVPPTFDCGDDANIKSPEPYILWAIKPDPGTPVTSEGSVKAFYQDEHALTMGSGATPSKGSQDHVTNPNVGDESARDLSGFPYFPALFVSDVTSDPNNRDGDAQNGGTPHKPDEVFGAWKALNGPNPQPANNLNLGPDADPYPTQSNVTFKNAARRNETSYGAEVVWKASNLGLTAGHTYRAQFILHDGDGGGGDTSEGCTTIQY